MPRQRTSAFARELRQTQTDAEQRLWYALRDRRLSGAKFRRQYQCGMYVLDFYCPCKKLAIELDGGQHASAAAREHDARRADYLAERGIKVLRFWDNDALLRTEAVLQAIWLALNSD
ncbi:MAG: endonuclease domain-containing protein [Ottowia sp.]|nr:endonuclease domain-containing protein [Ottowia sp.]